MSDYISREAAIEAVQDHYNADGFAGIKDGQTMLDRINAIPAADVREVKKSKWFDGRCTACGFKPALDYEYATVYDDYNDYRWNFCPNCGADMRGEQT